jgi:hypothetical protein
LRIGKFQRDTCPGSERPPASSTPRKIARHEQAAACLDVGRFVYYAARLSMLEVLRP